MGQQLTNLRSNLRRNTSQVGPIAQTEERLRAEQRQVTADELTQLQNQLQQRESRIASLQEQLRAKEQQVIQLNTTGNDDPPDWVINRNAREFQIMRDQELGRGAWGVVYRGTFCRCDVAIKEMHENIVSPQNKASFEREVDIATRCRHPCLLQFIGATNDGMRPLLVTEIMECTLRSRLYNEDEQALSEAEISLISLDVALALNYLHQKRPTPIIHSDISSANVLLWRRGNHWRGKVSDYGTANFVRRSTNIYQGAIIYIAPEYESRKKPISCKVDVYSFGVLLCEMSIRELPDPERRMNQIDRITNLKARNLVGNCTLEKPGERPNMEDLIDVLEEIYVTLQHLL